MKVQLWAKKLDGKGHVYLNTVDIPDGRREWRVPVRQPIKVRGFVDGGEMTPPTTLDAVRVFQWQYSPVSKLLGDMPKFLET